MKFGLLFNSMPKRNIKEEYGLALKIKAKKFMDNTHKVKKK